MTGWFVELLISEFIHRYFDVMAAFRFHPYYVNYLFSMFFWALLHSLQSGGIVKFEEISCISAVFELRRFLPVILMGGHFNFWSLPKG